jgi:DNA-binding MarR family transcriptional regulator
MNQPDIWIERISALRRNILKELATENQLQLVHLEILQYLSICNRYSNTTQAICRYLGQTKGTVSQSIKELEKKNLIAKEQDQEDKRIYHLDLTGDGKRICRRVQSKLQVKHLPNSQELQALEQMLSKLQVQNNFKGFGICANCKFNRKIDSNFFFCELTQQKLESQQKTKICNEFSAR